MRGSVTIGLAPCSALLASLWLAGLESKQLVKIVEAEEMSSAGTYGSDDVAGFNLVSRLKLFHMLNSIKNTILGC